jgi:hypothetical protein
MKWAGHVVRTREIIACTSLVGKSERNMSLGRPGIDGRMILKQVLNK